MSRFASRHRRLWPAAVFVVFAVAIEMGAERLPEAVPGLTPGMARTATVGRRGKVVVSDGRVSGYVGALGVAMELSPDGPPERPIRKPWRSVTTGPGSTERDLASAFGYANGVADVGDSVRCEWTDVGDGRLSVRFDHTGYVNVDCSGLWFRFPDGLEYGLPVEEARIAAGGQCRVGAFEATGGPQTGRFTIEPSTRVSADARGRITEYRGAGTETVEVDCSELRPTGAAQSSRRLLQLRPGMAEAEVFAALGPPSYVAAEWADDPGYLIWGEGERRLGVDVVAGRLVAVSCQGVWFRLSDGLAYGQRIGRLSQLRGGVWRAMRRPGPIMRGPLEYAAPRELTADLWDCLAMGLFCGLGLWLIRKRCRTLPGALMAMVVAAAVGTVGYWGAALASSEAGLGWPITVLYFLVVREEPLRSFLLCYVPVLTAAGAAWLIGRYLRRTPGALWSLATPVLAAVATDMAVWRDWPSPYIVAMAATAAVVAHLLGLGATAAEVEQPSEVAGVLLRVAR